ncbi:hypothetical protein GCM10023403_26540 [Pseudonocardia benzenivorans]
MTCAPPGQAATPGAVAVPAPADTPPPSSAQGTAAVPAETTGAEQDARATSVAAAGISPAVTSAAAASAVSGMVVRARWGAAVRRCPGDMVRMAKTPL